MNKTLPEKWETAFPDCPNEYASLQKHQKSDHESDFQIQNNSNGKLEFVRMHSFDKTVQQK